MHAKLVKDTKKNCTRKECKQQQTHTKKVCTVKTNDEDKKKGGEQSELKKRRNAGKTKKKTQLPAVFMNIILLRNKRVNNSANIICAYYLPRQGHTTHTHKYTCMAVSNTVYP